MDKDIEEFRRRLIAQFQQAMAESKLTLEEIEHQLDVVQVAVDSADPSVRQPMQTSKHEMPLWLEAVRELVPLNCRKGVDLLEEVFDVTASLVDRGRLIELMREALSLKRLQSEGFSFACYELAKQYEREGLHGESKKLVVAGLIFDADDGVVAAKARLGWAFLVGYGGEKNYAAGLALLRRAADHGNAAAANHIGIMYATGNGDVAIDKKEALTWFSVAARKGELAAKWNLAFAYTQGFDGKGFQLMSPNAFKIYLEMALEGHADAQNEVGCLYMKGGRPEEAEGFQWFHESALQGYAPAQFNLGRCFFKGIHVEKDIEAAIQWYEKAANQYFPEAAYELHRCYSKGIGVGKDSSKATKWRELAYRSRSMMREQFTCVEMFQPSRKCFPQESSDLQLS